MNKVKSDLLLTGIYQQQMDGSAGRFLRKNTAQIQPVGFPDPALQEVTVDCTFEQPFRDTDSHTHRLAACGISKPVNGTQRKHMERLAALHQRLEVSAAFQTVTFRESKALLHKGKGTEKGCRRQYLRPDPSQNERMKNYLFAFLTYCSMAMVMEGASGTGAITSTLSLASTTA